MTDLARIQHHHEAIHERCVEWGKWVKVNTRLFSPQPMFRHYRAPGRWDVETVAPTAINTLQALEVERAVATLPEKHKTVLRWAYVWPALHINAVCREMGVDRDGLGAIRDEALGRLAGSIIAQTTGREL
jgi:hypothetical protein